MSVESFELYFLFIAFCSCNRLDSADRLSLVSTNEVLTLDRVSGRITSDSAQGLLSKSTVYYGLLGLLNLYAGNVYTSIDWKRRLPVAHKVT